MPSDIDPFLAALPEEVPLPRAPLVRVIAQVRFPTIAAVQQAEFIAPFQEAIRVQYPILRPFTGQGLAFAAMGQPPVVTNFTQWRFSDAKEEWLLTLAPDFVALQTTAYESRADFIGRLHSVLEALGAHVRPAIIDRLGLRYIDRLKSDTLAALPQLVRPEILGVMGTAIAPRVAHSLSESVFHLEGQQMLARWGTLPPMATVDPSALEPIPERSWILDIDVFSTGPQDFSVAKLTEDARMYAAHVYTFFRWAVTSEFLRAFGGNV